MSQHDTRVPSDTVETDGVLSLWCQHYSHHRNGAGNQRIRTDLEVVINAMINKLISTLLCLFLVHVQHVRCKKRKASLMTASINASLWDTSLFGVLQNPPFPFLSLQSGSTSWSLPRHRGVAMGTMPARREPVGVSVYGLV